MSEDENRKLAEKVMGWTVRDSKGLYFDEPCLLVSDWHPRTSITQAMMLLEKFKWWMLNCQDDVYQCGVRDSYSFTYYSDWESTPEAAIVEAVLRAIEEG